jgi:2-polyprenyl-3-methyl-5-hydroxy-6-metoxy-1,4-benzoquinol methylase
MSKTNLRIWDRISDEYGTQLTTSTSEVHFGVSIPGNDSLELIPRVSQASAIDLGCGTGENLVALAKLGYTVTGIDGSTRQLELARMLLDANGIKGELVLDNVCNLSWKSSESFDLIISIGVMHFCSDIEGFLESCSKLAKTGTTLIVSVPHPLDMIVEVVEANNERMIIVNDYFPEKNRIEHGHYWEKFGGQLELAAGFSEYVYRPSDLINSMIKYGFQIKGVHEPPVQMLDKAPCTYRNPEPWFIDVQSRRIPQNLIVESTYLRRPDKSQG